MRDHFWFYMGWIPLLRTLPTTDFYQVLEAIMNYGFHNKPIDYMAVSADAAKVLRRIEPELAESLEGEIDG